MTPELNPNQSSATELAGRTDGWSARVEQPAALRRWSVAELIARAVAQPPRGGLAH